MHIGPPFVVDYQPAQMAIPGLRALDHPAVSRKPLLALDFAHGNSVLDVALCALLAATREVVALVRVQLLGSRARPTAPAAVNRWDHIQ